MAATRSQLLDMDRELDELYTRSMELKTGPALRRFMSATWPILEPAQPFVDSWHIGIIADVLAAVTAGEFRDVIITMPPRHSKSLTVAVFWPVWEWGPVNMPFTRWLFSSYAQALSARDSGKRRRIMASAYYRARWGARFTIGGNKFIQDGTVKYENDHTGYCLATSVKGSNTGEGGDRVVVDDSLNIKDRYSDLIREDTNEWWDNVMSTRRNNPHTSARVLMQQRSHERDVVGHVLSKPGHGYVHLNLPTEYEPPGCSIYFPIQGRTWRDPRTTPGQLLNPARFGAKEVSDAKRDLSEYDFSAQHQQNPTPADGGILKKLWWRWWAPDGHPLIGQRFTLGHGLPESMVVAMPGRMSMACSWDCAFKEGEDNSFVSGTAWAYDPDARHPHSYLLAEHHERMGFAATVDAVLQLHARYPGVVLVEDKANGSAILSHLANRVPGLIPADPGSRSKVERANSAQPFVRAGNIYLPVPDAAPWILEFIHELATFPNGAHNDRVDSTTQFIEWRYGGVTLRLSDMTADVDLGG